MKLTIVYDNDCYAKTKGLTADWGFSCLVETASETLLFDTGAKGNILLENMKILGINPSHIQTIVLSHEHWDHTGGLSALAPHIKRGRLFRLGSGTPHAGLQLCPVKSLQRISDDIVTTGQVPGSPVDEQALLLHGTKGWYLLVGCSHPGVRTLLTVIEQYQPLLGIIGGLHGFDEYSLLSEMEVICPTHCTRKKKTIKELYPTKTTAGGVGRTILI